MTSVVDDTDDISGGEPVVGGKSDDSDEIRGSQPT